MTVQLSDIAATLMRPTPAEDSVEGKAWTMWLGDAQRQIEARFDDLSKLDPATLDYVLREAVALKVKRPDPVVKIDVAVDDGSTSKTYERGSGQVEILDSWWAMLTPDPGDDYAGGAFTINPFGNRRC